MLCTEDAEAEVEVAEFPNSKNKKKYGLRDGAINRILYALEFFRFEQYVKAS